MSILSGLANTAAAGLLLALAGCGRAQAPAPTPANVATPEPARHPAPSLGAPSVAAPPMAAPEPEGSGPRNSFIICPGNPRCPNDGGGQK